MDSEAVKKLANELDISGCGSVNLEEFITAAMDRKRALTSETLTRVFSELDDDDDGELGPRVFCSALQDCHIDIKEEDVSDLMVEEGFCHEAEAIMRVETFKRCLLHGVTVANEGVRSVPCSRNSTFDKDTCPVSPTARVN